jgi:hydrogenase maturation protein HypF
MEGPVMVTHLAGARVHIRGVVQGVGFRPFVYGLAQRLELKGWVKNTSAGVDIEVEGAPQAIEAFLQALRTETPPLASLDEIQTFPLDPNGFASFEILPSQGLPDAFQPISPDMSVCVECLDELLDPGDRRHRYPFINCTNCGPRFTIIKDIPYDRPLTTMASFEMCPDCATEYVDPANRRFHAQPIACPVCGPHVWLECRRDPTDDSPSTLEGEEAIQGARALLVAGKVVAVKGLGGFHLACDATQVQAVETLRQRKLRVGKPFALMMPDLKTIEMHCHLQPGERECLKSHERPIVILERRAESSISSEVAPGQHTIGVMLPYTPLHHLLLEPDGEHPPALVMTSGNLSEEPIVTDNQDARERLDDLADAFLLHDRDIHIRCDDSVVRVIGGKVHPLRRARGYAPFPIRLPFPVPPTLASGAELKNTFCLARDQYAFLSHHIGDLQNYETFVAFEDGIAHFERLFRIQPHLLAYDLHPDYLATRHALARASKENLTAVGVQHHHAHIAACMAEHRLDGERPVIGVALDGTGYGDDGAIWGGEIMLADYSGYERVFHLEYVPMPGGEAAVRQPWRMALAWLGAAGLSWEDDLPPVLCAPVETRRVISRQLEIGLNTPQTSSVGRLFDAIAALIGVRQEITYEAQAAIELEAWVDPMENGAYPFPIEGGTLRATPMVTALVQDFRAGVSTGRMAGRFHNGLAIAIREMCRELRARTGIREVALSGGVWQNVVLAKKVVELLQSEGYTLYLHHKVPANDGGLSLGQVAVAAWRGRSLQRSTTGRTLHQ